MTKPWWHFNRVIALDLGGSITRIWVPGQGIVWQDDSVLAVNVKTNKVLAIGSQARQMRRRVSSDLQVIQPFVAGRIFDMNLAATFLRLALRKFYRRGLMSPTFIVSLPSTASHLSESLYTQLFYSIGAGEVILVNQVLAAAIGSGVPIADPSGALQLHLGASVVEAAVLSLGSTVMVETSLQAGWQMDKLIRYYLQKKFALTVGVVTAQKIKESIGTASEFLPGLKNEMLATGKNLETRAPYEVRLQTADILPPILDLVAHYEQLLKRLLERLPAELVVDVTTKGLLLSGGLARLPGLEQRLVQTIGIPVSLCDKPEEAVIRGLEQIAENLPLFKHSLGYQVFN